LQPQLEPAKRGTTGFVVSRVTVERLCPLAQRVDRRPERGAIGPH
jgi:hypothetical protein